MTSRNQAAQPTTKRVRLMKLASRRGGGASRVLSGPAALKLAGLLVLAGAVCICTFSTFSETPSESHRRLAPRNMEKRAPNDSRITEGFADGFAADVAGGLHLEPAPRKSPRKKQWTVGSLLTHQWNSRHHNMDRHCGRSRAPVRPIKQSSGNRSKNNRNFNLGTKWALSPAVLKDTKVMEAMKKVGYAVNKDGLLKFVGKKEGDVKSYGLVTVVEDKEQSVLVHVFPNKRVTLKKENLVKVNFEQWGTEDVVEWLMREFRLKDDHVTKQGGRTATSVHHEKRGWNETREKKVNRIRKLGWTGADLANKTRKNLKKASFKDKDAMLEAIEAIRSL